MSSILDFMSKMSHMALPAACIPEKTVVPVILPRDDTSLSLSVFPSCTRLERCGGCCSHPLLSCQPIREETVTLEVLVVDNRDFSDRLYIPYSGDHICVLIAFKV